MRTDTAESVAESLSQRSHRQQPQNMHLPELFKGIHHEMIEILREHLEHSDPHQLSLDAFGDSLRSLAYIARVYFGCELFLATHRQPNAQ